MTYAHLQILGANIRRLRKSRNLTQEDVAHKATLNSSYYGRIERGRVNLTIDTLSSIAVALNVELRDFFPSALTAGDTKRLRVEISKLVSKFEPQRLLLLRALLEMLSHQKK